jgi:hypothetical protein
MGSFFGGKGIKGFGEAFEVVSRKDKLKRIVDQRWLEFGRCLQWLLRLTGSESEFVLFLGLHSYDPCSSKSNTQPFILVRRYE